MSDVSQSVKADDPAEGAIAIYDEKQKRILRSEVLGVAAGAIFILGAVIVLSVFNQTARAEQGFRSPGEYNVAGVQQVNFVDYLTSRGQTVATASAEAVTAYNTWAAANPQTKNVQVLTAYLGDKYADTASVFGYMSQYVVPAVGQSCEYCHNLQDFSADTVTQKVTARAMFVMMFEVQRKWVDTIPRPEGQVVYQLQCASCHNGVAKFWNQDLFQTNPISFGITGGGLPVRYTFADEQFLSVRPDANNRVNYFQVIADKETPAGLAPVARNQSAMYHMSDSLGVGCDFCHYGGYFRSYTMPDGTFKWPKAQARHMMGMLQDITLNWMPQMPNVVNPAQPNCYMCHRNNLIPPGDIAPTEAIQAVANPLLKPLEEIPVPISVVPQQ